MLYDSLTLCSSSLGYEGRNLLFAVLELESFTLVDWGETAKSWRRELMTGLVGGDWNIVYIALLAGGQIGSRRRFLVMVTVVPAATWTVECV